ncbi:MAG: hypothetical protein IE909_12440, partial [Campylobacterales bacterium]|nr:hypothetical protein [Campylobacterales bacterium]
MSESLFSRLYLTDNQYLFEQELFLNISPTEHLYMYSQMIELNGKNMTTLSYILKDLLSQEVATKNRLNILILDMSRYSVLPILYDLNFSRDDRLKLLKRVFEDVIINDEESVLNPLLQIICKDDFYLTLGTTFNEKCKKLLEIEGTSYTSALDEIIVFFQGYKTQTIREQLIKDIALSILFPLNISGCNQTQIVRYGNFYYRYYHDIAQIIGKKVDVLIEEDFIVNGFWHCFTFVKGS